MRCFNLSLVAAVIAGLPLPCFSDDTSSIASSLQPFVNSRVIAGAVTLVASPDKVLSLETIGFSDLESKTPMKQDALFWIASMTKPMTCMAVMMLVEEGKVNIDDPVEKYLPEFKGQMVLAETTADHVTLKKPQRPVSLRDLLTHTSGLINKSPLESEAIDTLTLREAVLTYALSPLQFEPGSKWSNSNPGMNTLGRIIEVVSGQPYAEFMQERFFTPLGMKDTTFWPDEKQVRRLAKSYKQNAAKNKLNATTVTYVTPPLADPKKMPLAAAGLFSTAGDLVKIYQMVLNGGVADGRRYLKEETLKQMVSNQTGNLKVSFTEGMQMGLGFLIVSKPQGATETLSPGSFGHGGAYGTQAWIDPEKKLIMVLLIQRAGINTDASAMRGAFQKAAMERFGR